MKKNYLLVLIVLISFFSTVLLAERASAVEKNRATSNVGIQFYGEYPKTEETTETAENIISEGNKSMTNQSQILPSTGEKLQAMPLVLGLIFVGIGLLIIKKKKNKRQENF